MATASDLILRAFTRAGIRASETSLESDEIQDALSLLNDMLAEWEPLYHLGASPVELVADTVRIPRNANGAVIDNLAVRLCPEYSRPVSPALAMSANESLKNLLNARINLSNVQFPSTLPIGAGNKDTLDVENVFFSEQDERNF
jgi:hypothetical protein